MKQENCRNYNTVAEVPLARPSKKWLPGVATVHKNATYVEKKKKRCMWTMSWEDDNVERKRTKTGRVHRKGTDSKRETVSRRYKR